MAESGLCGTILGKRVVVRDLLVLCGKRVYGGAEAFVRNGGTIVEVGEKVYG